jgi:hypothetical protein
MLIAPLKPNGLPRPVQIPDMFRAIVTSYAVAKVFKSKEEITFIETGAGHTDPSYSQRGLSKDGCAYVFKETQRLLEEAQALDPPHLYGRGLCSSVLGRSNLTGYGSRPQMRYH